MPKLKPLHEQTFEGKALKTFKVYNDPFGEREMCVELAFVDGQIECVCIGSGRPEIVSRGLCHEDGLPSERIEMEVDKEGTLESIEEPRHVHD